MSRQNQTKYTFWTIHTLDGRMPSEADCYAWNEYLILWLENWADSAAWQWEEGELRTPHIQLCIQTKKRLRPLSLLSAEPFVDIEWMARPHVEPCHDYIKSFHEYCQKEEGRLLGPFTFGTPPVVTQGRRSDLNSFVSILRSDGLAAAIDHEPSVFAKYSTGLNRLAEIWHTFSPTFQRTSYLLYGPPGCGKSYWARFLTLPNIALPPIWCSTLDESKGWFQSLPIERPYRAVFDDFDGRRSGVPLRNLLRILDVYSIRVPCKGGYGIWQPTELVYTSNYKPQDWYDWRDRLPQWGALVRRYDVVLVWHSTDYTDFTVLERGSTAFAEFFAEPTPGLDAWRPPAITGTLDIENPATQ